MASIMQLHENESIGISQQKVRWGIMGSGRVCNDFVQALKIVEDAELAAVCSRSLDRAQKFASNHGIARAYGSYNELANDPEIDIVYIGSLHIFHRAHAEMCLKAGKHCLVEKPFTCTYEDAKFLIDLAREKNKFIMEGMWTRFFPAVKLAAQTLNSGDLGDVNSVRSDFSVRIIGDNETPDSDMFQPDKGGGGVFYLAPYPIAMVSLGFGPEVPQVSSFGIFGETGVDVSTAACLKYSRGLATVSYTLMAEGEEETDIIGTEGRLRIQTPCHCPTKISITKKLEGRGNIETQDHEFPLPEETAEITESGGFFYPNSIGFSYEATEVQKCIQNGLIECPEYTHEEMLTGMHIVSEIGKQIGVPGVTKEKEGSGLGSEDAPKS